MSVIFKFIIFFGLLIGNIYSLEISSVHPNVGNNQYPGMCFYTNGEINFRLDKGISFITWKDPINYKIFDKNVIYKSPFFGISSNNLKWAELTVYPTQKKLRPITYYIYHVEQDGTCLGLAIKDNTNILIKPSINSTTRYLGWSNVTIDGGGFLVKPNTYNARIFITIKADQNLYSKLTNYDSLANFMLLKSYEETNLLYMPWGVSSRALLNMIYIKYLGKDVNNYKSIYASLGGGTDDLLWALSAGAMYKNIRLNHAMNCSQLNCDLVHKRDIRDFIAFAGSDNNVFVTNLNGIKHHDTGYLNLPFMLALYRYVNGTTNFSEPGVGSSSNWYGVPWKDHDRYNYYFNNCSSCWGRALLDGFRYRNSITNALFWFYSTQLLQSNLIEISNENKSMLKDNIAYEYQFFFGSPNYFNWQYGSLISDIGISDGYKLNNGVSSYIDNATLSYNAGMVLGSLAETYLLDPTQENANKFLGAGIFVLNRAIPYFRKDGKIFEPISAQYGGPWPLTDDRKLFPGIYATMLSVFGYALNDAIKKNYVITYNNKSYNVEQVKFIYQDLKALVQNTADFIWSYYGEKPTAAWLAPIDSIYLNNLDSDYLTKSAAAGVFIGAAIFDKI
jgi:hypothetical protein